MQSMNVTTSKCTYDDQYRHEGRDSEVKECFIGDGVTQRDERTDTQRKAWDVYASFH